MSSTDLPDYTPLNKDLESDLNMEEDYDFNQASDAEMTVLDRPTGDADDDMMADYEDEVMQEDPVNAGEDVELGDAEGSDSMEDDVEVISEDVPQPEDIYPDAIDDFEQPEETYDRLDAENHEDVEHDHRGVVATVGDMGLDDAHFSGGPTETAGYASTVEGESESVPAVAAANEPHAEALSAEAVANEHQDAPEPDHMLEANVGDATTSAEERADPETHGIPPVLEHTTEPKEIGQAEATEQVFDDQVEVQDPYEYENPDEEAAADSRIASVADEDHENERNPAEEPEIETQTPEQISTEEKETYKDETASGLVDGTPVGTPESADALETNVEEEQEQQEDHEDANIGGASATVGSPESVVADQNEHEEEAQDHDDDTEDASLFPVVLTDMNQKSYALFAPINNEKYQGLEVLLHDDSLAFEPLELLIAAFRMEVSDRLPQDIELTLEFPSLALSISEDNVYSREVTLLDVVNIYTGIKANEQIEDIPPLEVQLGYKSRFIARFNELANMAASRSRVDEGEEEYEGLETIHEHPEEEDEVVEDQDDSEGPANDVQNTEASGVAEEVPAQPLAEAPAAELDGLADEAIESRESVNTNDGTQQEVELPNDEVQDYEEEELLGRDHEENLQMAGDEVAEGDSGLGEAALAAYDQGLEGNDLISYEEGYPEEDDYENVQNDDPEHVDEFGFDSLDPENAPVGEAAENSFASDTKRSFDDVEDEDGPSSFKKVKSS
ncbi:hypothetical protein SAICODRAFT_18036 [Saitoella complicata NRRL Y-17804]|uniref:uncharacterized protein n=1 Tax=Saitoella complicata (strain BCRC 22490 / CBS 7301 / JCM 7358 / NBRC 10748 / NRRL Y-17804) TaxID=698492 RepID=UPI000866EE51|nr:uncharacterized protein SAICODRAFT_18036 [Saitoella complicata NRRL Y-17804]ODQ54503.1 hypothetical protein SAICODRAFT_18036 [Saitoella complicata NRRL Y-17804]